MRQTATTLLYTVAELLFFFLDNKPEIGVGVKSNFTS